jgi:hypothetical protein
VMDQQDCTYAQPFIYHDLASCSFLQRSFFFRISSNLLLSPVVHARWAVLIFL